jgi:hypothetical protein
MVDELIHPSAKVTGVLGSGGAVLADELIHLPRKAAGVFQLTSEFAKWKGKPASS